MQSRLHVVENSDKPPFAPGTRDQQLLHFVFGQIAALQRAQRSSVAGGESHARVAIRSKSGGRKRTDRTSYMTHSGCQANHMNEPD